MSYCGVSQVAELLAAMQELRVGLLYDPSDHQNMMLSQLLEKGKDAMADGFAMIAAGETKKARKEGE